MRRNARAALTAAVMPCRAVSFAQPKPATKVTAGRIVNGRKSSGGSDVTKILNGPSCSGTIAGADVVKRTVKTGDIIIIPAGVPHGWTDIADHVDYLSFRPSDHVLEAGYVHPSIKK